MDPMDPSEAKRVLDALIPVLCQAGQLIRALEGGIGQPDLKDDGSPVTRADRASHDLLLDALQRLTPGYPVISEEGDLERIDTQAPWYWLVDPLDGTKEYLQGNGEYTINVALLHVDRPVLGLIHVPTQDTTYFAAEGQGAFKQPADRPPAPIRTYQGDRPPIAVVTRSHLNAETQALLAALGVTNIVPCGSALKQCILAEGGADIYPRAGPIHFWDIAAGVILVREAGGTVVDLEDAPLRFDLSRGLTFTGFLMRNEICTQ